MNRKFIAMLIFQGLMLFNLVMLHYEIVRDAYPSWWMIIGAFLVLSIYFIRSPRRRRTNDR